MKKIFLFFTLIISLNVTQSYNPRFELFVTNQFVNFTDNSVTFDIFVRAKDTTINNVATDTIFYFGNCNFYFTFYMTNFKNLAVTYEDGSMSGFLNEKGIDCSSYYDGTDAGGITIYYYGNGETNNTIYIDVEGSNPSSKTQFDNHAARITKNRLTHRIGTFKVATIQDFDTSHFGLMWKQGSPNFPLVAYVDSSTFNIYNFPGDTITIFPPVPLPVTIAYFNSQIYTNSVKLLWETTWEQNNARFIIERMISGSNTWINVGNVQGHGNSNSPIKYVFEDSKLATNIYDYRLKQVDYNGNFEYYNLNQPVNIGKPGSFSLGQNYPNPSNPKAIIDYQIPFDSRVKIVVYDLLGREVVKLVDENKQAGYYSAIFDGTNLASGVYIYRLSAENSFSKFDKSMKMVLIK